MLSAVDKKIFQSVDDLSRPAPTIGNTPTYGVDQWKDCSPGSGATPHPDGLVFLTETFYISSKKNTVFQVRLTSQGLILRKECNGTTAKEQKILLRDIIGCRCLRSKKKVKRNGKTSACTCSFPSAAQLKVVEANSGEQDESDTSAYLYIYAYIPKSHDSGNNKQRDKGGNTTTANKFSSKTKAHKSNPTGHYDDDNGRRRDRTTITLRFRSFDKYEQNHQEAQKWRFSIKSLINRQVSDQFLMYSANDGGEVNSATKMSLVYSPRVHDPRKTLVIVNPKSGSGKARESFQQRVAPMLTEAEMNYDMYVTKYPNFAREFVRARDVYSWKNIVVVGGDGIYYEVLNGICERPDWERVLDEIPIGIIPCGSGNGLAKSISHMARVRFSVVEATLAIIRGRSVPMDVVRVENKSQIMFSFLSVGWGLIADIDIESERLRALGGQRFTIWSVHRLISLRTYRGRISYRPANHIAATMENGKQHEGGNPVNGENKRRSSSLKHSKSCSVTLGKSGGGDSGEGVDDDVCDACDMMEFGEVLSLETSISGTTHGGGRSRMDSFYSVGSKRSSYFSTAESVYQDVNGSYSGEGDSVDDGGGGGGEGDGSTKKVSSGAPIYGPASNIPALTAPVPSSWTVMEGEFIMAHTAYQTHLGSDCYFAKRAALNDGVIWLCVIKGGIPRTQLLSFLLGLSAGTHIPEGDHEYVKMIPCTAFRIEPEGDQGHITVDGERVEYGPIQGEVFEGMVNVTVPDVGE